MKRRKKRNTQKILIAILAIFVFLGVILAFYSIFKINARSKLKDSLLSLGPFSDGSDGSDDYNVCDFDISFDDESVEPPIHYDIYGMQKNMDICPPCQGEEVEVHDVVLPSSTGSDKYLTVCDSSSNDYACYEAYFSELRPEATVCHQCSSLSIPSADWEGYIVDKLSRDSSLEDSAWTFSFSGSGRETSSACNPDAHCPIHEACPGDTNGDGFVDLYDIQRTITNWLEEGCAESNGCCKGTDVNDDGVVNYADLAIISGSLGECPDLYD